MKTRKELKEEYKQKRPIAGVFQIKNQENGMILIDASTNIMAKWNRHKTELRFGSHRNHKLQADWNQFGEEKFKASIISKVKTKEAEMYDLRTDVAIMFEQVLKKLNLKVEMKY